MASKRGRSTTPLPPELQAEIVSAAGGDRSATGVAIAAKYGIAESTVYAVVYRRTGLRFRAYQKAMAAKSKATAKSDGEPASSRQLGLALATPSAHGGSGGAANGHGPSPLGVSGDDGEVAYLREALREALKERNALRVTLEIFSREQHEARRGVT